MSHIRERVDAEQARPEPMSRLGEAVPAIRSSQMTASAVRSLQMSAGNQAVAGMLSPRSSGIEGGGSAVVRTPFSVAIPLGDMAAEPAHAIPAGGSRDNKYEAHPTTPEEIVIPEVAPAPAPAPAPEAPSSSSATSETAAPAEGVVIKLPDVIKPELLEIQVCDAVGGALTYAPAVANTATPGATEFGICRFGDCKVTGVTAKLESGTYTVAGTIEHKITWGVHPTTDNETDISGDTDPDITKANYPDVVKDLTPNMSSSGGRPPRNAFWAKDLTEIHELFHADDVKKQGPGAVTTAVNWLKTKTAGSVADVTALVNQVPDRVVQTLAAGMGEPAEVRAYGGGAAAYTTRAQAIEKRGKANEYK
jgi:hypothetical protein